MWCQRSNGDLHPNMKRKRVKDFVKICLVICLEQSNTAPFTRLKRWSPKSDQMSFSREFRSSHCLSRTYFIDFERTSFFRNRGDHIDKIFHWFHRTITWST